MSETNPPTSRGASGRAQPIAFGSLGVVLLAVGLVFGLLIGLNVAIVIGLVAVIAGGAYLLLRVRARRTSAATDRVGFGAVAAHALVVMAATLIVIQVIPYGRTYSNPAVTGEPAWSSPRTRELAVAACFGCHSNETKWPWYAKVAPTSWAVASHVEEGRAALNFSEFNRDQEGADEVIEVIKEGSMPPRYYTRFGLHPEAKLSDAEVAEFIAGLQMTPGLAGESGGESSE